MTAMEGNRNEWREMLISKHYAGPNRAPQIICKKRVDCAEKWRISIQCSNFQLFRSFDVKDNNRSIE